MNNNNCYWDFGDGSNSLYFYGENPTHFYTDTGNFNVSLYLENKGLCKDSFSTSVCLISENKLFIPNIFTPNDDNCNDVFYFSGLGEFLEFNLKIYNRWGELVFESDKVIFTNNNADQNHCNDDKPFYDYYRMGEWDGFLENGEKAIPDTYVFVATYYLPNSYQLQTEKGNILLIR